MGAWGVGSFVFLHLVIEVVHLGHFVGRRVLGAADSLLLAMGHLAISLGRQLSPDVRGRESGYLAYSVMSVETEAQRR